MDRKLMDNVKKAMGFRWTKEFGASQDPFDWSRRDGLPVSEEFSAAR